MIRQGYRAAGAGAIAGILVWSAWRYGLFFDAQAYVVEMVLFVSAMAAMVPILRNVGGLPAWPAVLFPLGMAACYAITLLFEPASFKGTVDSVLRWTAFAGWTALLSAWWSRTENRASGEWAIQAAGVFLLAGGWFGWFGWLSFPDIVLRFHDPQLSATGARLAGFFQYPNAYGAVMAFFVLRQWQRWAGGSKAAALLACVTAVPYGSALILTESRGSMAALLLGFVCAFAWAGDRPKRVRLLLAAVWTALGAFVAAHGALAGFDDGASGGWLTALAFAAGAGVLYGLWLWLERLDESGEGRGWKAGPRQSKEQGKAQGREQEPGYEPMQEREQEPVQMRIPYPWQFWISSAVIVLGVLLYIWIGGLGTDGRIAGSYGTAASRLLFYRDAWSMFLDSPWLGFGGDSWRSLFGLYQTQPYVGGEVHSGYLEILLDTGLLGMIVFAAMLGYWIWRLWKAQRQALAPAVVLLVHAAVDFDFSYAWMWLLLFAWFALFAAEVSGGQPAVRRKAGGAVTAMLLIGASAWGVWAAWHGDAAARAVAAAGRAAEPAVRLAKLRAALEANPAWSRIRLMLDPLLPEAGERESMLAAGLRYEPQAAPLMLRLGMAAAEQGDVAQAESRLREALRLERFSRDAQTAAVAAMVRLAEMHRFQGRADEARRADQAAVSFYETYRRLAHEVQAMDHPANGKRFAMTPAAEFQAAKAYLGLERADEARTLLRRLAEGDDSDWKQQAQQLLYQIDGRP